MVFKVQKTIDSTSNEILVRFPNTLLVFIISRAKHKDLQELVQTNKQKLQFDKTMNIGIKKAILLIWFTNFVKGNPE
jgi:hypothetical protein